MRIFNSLLSITCVLFVFTFTPMLQLSPNAFAATDEEIDGCMEAAEAGDESKTREECAADIDEAAGEKAETQADLEHDIESAQSIQSNMADKIHQMWISSLIGAILSLGGEALGGLGLGY